MYTTGLLLPVFRILIDAKSNSAVRQVADAVLHEFGHGAASEPQDAQPQAEAPPADPAPRHAPIPQDAATKPAVSKREQTAPSMPVNGSPDGQREAAAVPGVPATSPDGKPEQTANGRPKGQASLPDAHSRPSANGANGQQHRHAPQQPQRPQPSGQGQRKPPKR